MVNKEGVMLVGGIPVKEWIDAPYGAFKKAVRESIDPKWGCDAAVGEERQWEVVVDYSYSGRGRATYTVNARDEKEAEEKAMNEFDSDSGLDFFDAEVDDANVRKATKLD
jgi:hypothetical protein